MARTEFTKKGHRFELVEGQGKSPIFRCHSRAMYIIDGAWHATDGHVLADMLVWAPCTVGQMSATLRAWLAVYDDAELLEQVESVVQQAIAGMPSTATTPSMAPQKGQGMSN